MKMKKIAAASLAVCVCALSGMSALAANVTTTTTYDWNNRDKADATVKVTSVVSGVDVDTQVTYLVWGGDESTIKYIDQKAANAAGATFEFTGKQGEIYNNTITAKFGSNGSYTLPKNFKFNDGVNYITAGDADVSKVAGFEDGDYNADGDTGKAYYGKVSGEVAEYGVKVEQTGKETLYFPAAGSTDEGVFCVVISNLPSDATVSLYCEPIK